MTGILFHRVEGMCKPCYTTAPIDIILSALNLSPETAMGDYGIDEIRIDADSDD